MFSMKGIVGLSDDVVQRTVTWNDDGTLDGDPVAVFLFEFAASQCEGFAFGPVEGQQTFTAEDHLRSPFSVQDVANRVFLPGWTMTGDVPTVRGNRA